MSCAPATTAINAIVTSAAANGAGGADEARPAHALPLPSHTVARHAVMRSDGERPGDEQGGSASPASGKREPRIGTGERPRDDGGGGEREVPGERHPHVDRGTSEATASDADAVARGEPQERDREDDDRGERDGAAARGRPRSVRTGTRDSAAGTTHAASRSAR